MWQTTVDAGVYTKLGDLVVESVEGAGVLDAGEHAAAGSLGASIVTQETLGEHTQDVDFWVRDRNNTADPNSLTLRIYFPLSPDGDASDDFTLLSTDDINMFILVRYR